MEAASESIADRMRYPKKTLILCFESATSKLPINQFESRQKLTMQSSQMKRCFDAAIKRHGYTRKGASWYLEAEEAIGVVNLQASNYSGSFYVNLALWLKALGEVEYPKEHQCHIRLRLLSAFPAASQQIETAFDLEDQSLSDEQRQTEIHEIVEYYIVPFIDKLTKKNELVDLYRSGKLSRSLIHRNARELLNAKSNQ